MQKLISFDIISIHLGKARLFFAPSDFFFATVKNVQLTWKLYFSGSSHWKTFKKVRFMKATENVASRDVCRAKSNSKCATKVPLKSNPTQFAFPCLSLFAVLIKCMCIVITHSRAAYDSCFKLVQFMAPLVHRRGNSTSLRKQSIRQLRTFLRIAV